ncbi:MAG: DoxX family protein [Bacteroidota bacterium]
MNTISKIIHWGDTHHPGWMDGLRILLGLILFIKGVQFAGDPKGLYQVLEGHDLTLYSFFLVNYIAMAHLAGGVLIILGLLTRITILFQLPILLGAVIFNGMSTGILDFYSEFYLSLFTLGMLVLFLVYGSGPVSIDEHIKRNP